MKKTALFFLLCFFVVPSFADEGLITVKSRFKVAHTTDRFIGVVQKNGLHVFSHINHSEGAEKAGLKLRPTELVIFGNPKLGTPLMQCSPTLGIDLPQKLLIWQDENEQTWMTYNNPVYIADRHHLNADCRGNLNKIANALANFTKLAGDAE